MKRMSFVTSLALVIASATLPASVTLTSLTGSPNVRGTATFSVNAASSAREIWCAWGDSDKGTSFAAWPNNERVCTVPANATAITSELPPGAKKATVARFFLFPAGQSYAVDYLVTTGSQGFDTGIVPEPSIVVSADVLLNDPLVIQQRAFGTADNALTVASYINGNGYWAWGFQNTQGNWYSLDVAPDAGRAHTTFDGPNNRITLEVGGKPYKTVTVSTTRTNTGTLTVAFCCARTSSGYSYFMQDGRFYGGTLSTASAGAHAYVPYVQAGVAGVKDTATDAFIGNAPGTGAFGTGGRTDATGAEAGDLVHLAKLSTGDVWSDAAYLFDFSTDLNGDGSVQKGEIRNALHFGSTNENGSAVNLGHTMYIAPDGCNKLAWKTADIPLPSRGLTHASATYLDFPANVQRSNITNTWRNGFSLPGNFTGEVTVVARVFVRNFKFDNLGNSVSIFLNNGLDWNKAFGSEFGFTGSGQPYSIQGNKTFTASQITLRTNRWYDVAYTLKNIGNGRADATFAVAESCLSGTINTGLVFQVVKQDAGCFTNETFYTEASRAIKVGGEDIGGWHRGGDNSGQGAKGFNGGLQRLAVWRRVLSRDEIGEASFDFYGRTLSGQQERQARWKRAQNVPNGLLGEAVGELYVERYFADFLSAMESKEAIPLWNGCPEPENEDDDWDDTPKKIKLPSNLFIIGTINVDETTYMFSPKVLDRANVIEFKISAEEMSSFLENMKDVHPDNIISKAANMSASFVDIASKNDLEKDAAAVVTLKKFFQELKNVNAEFGYRSATEIFRFICQAKNNDDTATKITDNEILDAAIVQKLLPKLHGSRKKLDPVLKQLWRLCFDGAESELPITDENAKKAKFKESADKIWRMYESASANGFTSFAEA